MANESPPGDKQQLKLAMSGGEGEESYAQNCRVQAGGFTFVKKILSEALGEIELPWRTSFKIADLGCSSGPNTVAQMNFMVNTIRERYTRAPSIPTPEFDVIFADLLLNDFNSLFRFIDQGRKDAKMRAFGCSEYFSCGVAGSFYGRLMSKACLDVVFSSFSLHWLSKIPEEVKEPDSPAFNNGFVWIHGGKASVGKAYAKQAKLDMCAFLRARAEEMVPGGLVFLLLKGRKSSDPNTQYDSTGTSMFGFHMEDIFDELVNEKILDNDVRDAFNVPIYYRTVEEMREAVHEVSEFEVKRMEQLSDVPGNCSTPAELRASPTDCGKRVAKMCRCLLGILLESHMGKRVADEFFYRLERRAIKRSEAEARENRIVQLDVNLAVLIRK